MGDSFCGQCGARKKPLAYSTYCPNDCDRLVPRRDPISAEELSLILSKKECPWCGTFDTEPFPDCDAGDWHCNPHGHVWWGDGQEA